MRVLNICFDDYANLMFNMGLALKAAGVECESVKTFKHPFNYSAEATVIEREEIASMISRFDVIQFFHSGRELFQYLAPFLRRKKVVAWHTGTPYRRNPPAMNALFNPVVDMCMTDQCEFMFLGAKRIRYMAAAMNVDDFPAPKKIVPGKIRVAHFPSNKDVKGSDDIIRMMNIIKRNFSRRWLQFIYSEEKVSHPQQLARMNDCDIYVELFKGELEGKLYGCFGVTAFEAAAMGKIVVTQNIFPNTYPDEYGLKPPFIICNTEREFIENVNALIGMNRNVLDDMQRVTRKWLIENHSFEATGRRLRSILESI